MPAVDQRELRNILGSYATGVAVATCRDAAGQRAAMTINSFASVSLSPPRVLWSIGETSEQFAAFCEATHYAINILSDEHRALSTHFATSSPDKFAGIDSYDGIAGLPLLPDCCALLQCKIVERVRTGDHVILIGEVLDAERADRGPLIFHRSAYHGLA